MLRLERSTSGQQRRPFFQKLIQTSSSVCLALDTVRISSSLERLTSGMGRGPSFLVARLPFPPQAPFSLRELCLILSFFPAFSPLYKLREEQCYWFCDVLLSTVCAACDSVSVVKEEGFKRAGKFGMFSVQLSPQTRKLFVDAYSIVRALGMSPGPVTLSNTMVTPESVNTLVSMLEVPSSEARTRALIALTFLASKLSQYSQTIAAGGAAAKIISIIPDASPRLKEHIFAALDVIIDASVVRGLEEASIHTVTHFLSSYLFLDDTTACKKALSMLCIINTAEACSAAFVSLSSSLSLELPPHSQFPVLKAIISCVNQKPLLITDEVLARLFDILSPAAPVQTRMNVIFSLTRLIRRHRSILRATSGASEAGIFFECILKKFVCLLMDNTAAIRHAASQGLTKLANYSERGQFFNSTPLKYISS